MAGSSVETCATRIAPSAKDRTFPTRILSKLLCFDSPAEGLDVECYAVSADAEGHGSLSSIDMDGLKATYDSNKGLLISVPVRSFDSNKSRSVPAGRVKVRISRKNNKNSVTIER